MIEEIGIVIGLILLVYIIEKLIFFGIKVKKNYNKIGELNQEYYYKEDKQDDIKQTER